MILPESIDVFVRKSRLATDGCEQRAELDPLGRPHGGLEDLPNFGLGAATVMGRSHPESTVGFIGQIAYGDCWH